MYIVTVLFEAAPEHADAFAAAMHKQAKNSFDHEPACRQFDVCFDPDRPERCFLYEKYDTRAAFDLHLASDHFQSFNTQVTPWVLNKEVRTWIESTPTDA